MGNLCVKENYQPREINTNQKGRKQSQMSKSFHNNCQSQKGNIENLKSFINQKEQSQLNDSYNIDKAEQIIKAKSGDAKSSIFQLNKTDNKLKARNSMHTPLIEKESKDEIAFKKVKITNPSSLKSENQTKQNYNQGIEFNQNRKNISSTSQQVSNNQAKVLEQYKNKIAQLQTFIQNLTQKLKELTEASQNSNKKLLEKAQIQVKELTFKLSNSQKNYKNAQKEFQDTKLKLLQTESNYNACQKKKQIAQSQNIQLKNNYLSDNTDKIIAQNKQLKKTINQLQKKLKYQTNQLNLQKNQISRLKITIDQLKIQVQTLKQNIQQQKHFNMKLLQKQSNQTPVSLISSGIQKNTQKGLSALQVSITDSESTNRSLRKSIIIRLFKDSKILYGGFCQNLVQAIIVRQKIEDMFTLFYGQGFPQQQGILQTNRLFEFDKITPNKYFQYIIGKNNLFLIAKLNDKTIFGGFIRHDKTLADTTKQSFLYSISKQSDPIVLRPIKEIRPINQVQQYINFGDNQIKIKTKTRQCSINIGCMGCMYKTLDGKVPDSYQFLKISQKKFQIQDYQIYEIEFGKQKC